MAAKKTTSGKKKLTGLPCPNPDKAYSLWGLVGKLVADKGFAQDFLDLLKEAEQGVPGASDCVDTYLTPETSELQNLGIAANDIPRMKKCTDSGLLVLVTAAQQNLRKK